MRDASIVPCEIGDPRERCNKESQMRFRARVRLSGKTATGVLVPAEVVDGLGRSERPPATVDGHTYRSTLASLGGEFMVAVSEQREGCSEG
jgi:hypothetical protein